MADTHSELEEGREAAQTDSTRSSGQHGTELPALVSSPYLEPDARPPMLMRAVYPFGLSLRGWRRILLTGIFILFALSFLIRVQAVLPPFIIAFVVASLLDPSVRYLQTHRRTRAQAILTLYLLGILVVTLLIVLVFPAARRQIEEVSGNITTYFGYVQRSSDTWMMRHASTLRIFGIHQNTVGALLSQKSSPIQEKITEALATITAFLQSLASQAIWLIIIPVATFFFLRDYTAIRARIIALFPERLHGEIDQVWCGIADVFSAYIQGLAKICSLYGIVVFALLTLLGQRYALFIGLMAGAFYAVPLIGPWFVAVTAALLTYSEPQTLAFSVHIPVNSFPFAILVLLAVIVAQMCFDQLVYPRVVGGSVGLHPILSIFALMCGANLFGILGMVIAVPVAGSLQILLTYFFPRIAQQPPEHLLHELPPCA